MSNILDGYDELERGGRLFGNHFHVFHLLNPAFLDISSMTITFV